MATTVAAQRLGGSRSDLYVRETDPATNVGAGAMFRMTDWLGIGADYKKLVSFLRHHGLRPEDR